MNTKPLQILLVGSGAPGALELAYQRALARLPDIEVRLFAVDAGNAGPTSTTLLKRALLRMLVGRRNREIRARLRDDLRLAARPPDAIIIFKGMAFSRQFLRSCAKAFPTCAWINLNPDDPTNLSSRGSTNRDVFESMSFFDLYVTWSRSVAADLQARGCRRTVRIPFGYDADVHRPPEAPVDLGSPISTFVGTWDKERESTLEVLAGNELEVYGANWNRSSSKSLRSCLRGGEIHGEQFSRKIRDSLASINLLRPQNRDSHNMRTFEIPAVGGLMITHSSPELCEFLKPGVDCLTFDTPRELREVVLQVSRNPRSFDSMRERGLRAIAPHSYDARAKILAGHIAEIVAERRSRMEA